MPTLDELLSEYQARNGHTGLRVLTVIGDRAMWVDGAGQALTLWRMTCAEPDCGRAFLARRRSGAGGARFCPGGRCRARASRRARRATISR